MKLTGKSFSAQKFKVLEDNRIANIDIINAMLKGSTDLSIPIYVVRNYMDPENCNKIKEQFHKIIDETRGGNRFDDFVKVHQIGATQFHKESREYFDECNNTKENVNDLIRNLKDKDLLNDFMLETTLRDYFLEKKIHFGPTYNKGNYCNLFTARLWRDEKEKKLALNAHDDLAQLEFAKKDEFEIGNVKNVVASNLCIDNDEETKLLLWNIFPDKASKEALNLKNTGYPYPLSILENVEYISLKTYPGDLYFINANYVHAVEKSEKDKRISLGRFLGYSSPKRVAYWT